MKKGVEKTTYFPGRKLEPCICGSKVCEKRWKLLKQEHRHWQLREALNLKKCICGSPICDEESLKMPEVLLEEAKEADNRKYMAKKAIENEKRYQKERKIRAKEREKARKLRDKLRKKQDKLEMKAITKDENAGNVRMISESLIDLGSFGSKAFCEVARFGIRAIRRPRDVYLDIRDTMSDPGAASKNLKRGLEDIGLFATCRRIRTRIGKMPLFKSTIKTMESHQLTNYMIHMSDPKLRNRKFKKRITREPRDFECSPYMASMRKRPCLAVYYKCAWFYPHCLSLLGVWKQFIDLLLFLLAVLIWSPCILLTEACRACVCCFMCQ